MRYLALGDSYTIGEGVAPAERWPVQLVQRLRTEGEAVAVPEIIAQTGWTTHDLHAALDAADPEGPYRLVSLLIGVNDQYDGAEAEAYREAFTTLLGRAIGYAGGEAQRVLVVSIPDWGGTPFAADEGRDPNAVAEAIDAYNAVNQSLAKERGAAYVDVTPHSRAHAEAVVADGLHPTAAVYAAWAEAALPAARAALTITYED